jgi:hypothetical protein
MRRFYSHRVFVGIVFCVLACPRGVFAASVPLLWQERYYFDALIEARDRQSRSESDPNLVPVLRSIAGEVLQQAANVGQIDSYAKTQLGSLRYAFGQDHPNASLKIVGLNLSTLGQGMVQVKNNLAYLTVRSNIAFSQALPDPQIYQNSLLILAEIKRLQLEVNSLYLDSIADDKVIKSHQDDESPLFVYQSQFFIRSLYSLQGEVFSLYNSAYDIALRAR